MGGLHQAWTGRRLARIGLVATFFVASTAFFAPVSANPSGVPAAAEPAFSPEFSAPAEIGFHPEVALPALQHAVAAWAPGRHLAQDLLWGLLDTPADEASLNALRLAVAEASGHLPSGLASRLWTLHQQQTSAPAPGPAERIYRDARSICDTNDDGWSEVLVNEYNLATLRSTVRMLDGKTGRSLWLEPFGMWFHTIPPDERTGDPLPDNTIRPLNLHAMPDLNGDGICDFFIHTFITQGQLGLAVRIVGTITAHSGAGPYLPLWTRPYDGLYVSIQDPTGTVAAVELLGYPTAFLAYPAGDGFRLLFKTTDVHVQRATEQLATGYWAQNYLTADHLVLLDGRTGAQAWLRDLSADPTSGRTNFTWVAGATDVTGDGEPDIVLDQAWITNPRSNAEQDNPLDGTPLFRFGRGMDVLALDAAAAGRTLWTAVVWDDEAARLNPPQQEENFEELRLTHASILGDLTGDGIGDILAQALTQEGQEETTVNGAYRTHFVPVSGADGSLPWGNQVKFQGWGAASLLVNGDERRVAVGTMDVPTEVPPQSRFPPKDLRLAVLDADGSPRWTHQAAYPQDSFLGFDLALQQFQRGLAPYDHDGDGWKDLVTPGQYVAPAAGQQLLLSQANQTFEILAAASGRTIVDIRGFGSNGILLPCGGGYALIGGYGQHLETAAYDLQGRPQWDAVLWLDPTPTAASAGVDLTFLGAHCQEATDGRWFVQANAGLYSLKRSDEILPMYGYPNVDVRDEDGNPVAWMTPNFLAKRDLLAKLAELLQPPPPPTVEERATWAGAPMVPGLLLGVSLGFVANRRNPKPAKPTKVDLPDLYGGR